MKMWRGNLKYYIAERHDQLYWLPKTPRSPIAWRNAKPYMGKHPDLLGRESLPTWIVSDYYNDMILKY